MGLFTLILVTELNAQETVLSSGGNAQGVGGTVSYSVGQVAYVSHSSASGVLSEGVQQPFVVSVITEVVKNSIYLNAVAYPNPALEELHLEIGDNEYNQLEYLLYDLEGKLLAKEFVTNGSASINMVNYHMGMYILKVHADKTLIKEFKISKK